MSKYTTELRFIVETSAGLSESVGYSNINETIANALPNLFNFDFPIFDEEYRTVLETKIVKHYYTREIGYETVGRWKLALETKLNEIMPYYNKLYESELLEFNPLYTHNITKSGNKQGNTTDNESKTRQNTDDTRHNETQGHTGTDSVLEYNLHSDTPQGGLTGVDSETYLSDAQKTTTTDTKNLTDTVTINHTVQSNGTDAKARTLNNTDQYLETIVGYEGTNASENLLKYRETFINIDMMIINDLSKLFMGLW